ncbi:hypothetical protein BX661DRAFT_222636 [Kickxella alabastrina]|uniref:uncharacterized protein n=1 Tax=Kickxella alabastrina TaxID=61397 RepID=UPI002220889F|nr:uncharacterized protein BX661DRAFT_222636 [Kickxella alabastrina]KAI7833826.1 hypothetical protein BX661DRAFT_222636 [Kickxella alabastrina]
MSQSENNSSKRQTASSSARSSKRARTTSADHTPDCQDKHCKGCASGEILLSSDITSLDRPIVSELYETAVKKLGEYVDYEEYATMAVAMAKGGPGVGVCLKQDNWRDPEEDEIDEDQEQKAIVPTHSLINALRLVIMDSALSMITTHIDWDSSDSEPPDAEDVGEQIESRLAAVLKYLESQNTDCTCCKLRAQLLIVLSGVVSDEDRAMGAFDSADQDIVSQLEDLGAEM